MGSGVKPRGPALVGYGERGDDSVRLPSPPTQARGVEKRDRIYESAIARFQADGIAATTIEDVIADAEVSWATFFRYYPRKGDVLIELAARHFNGPVRKAAADGIADGRFKVRTVIERTFAVLLMPGATTAELHTAALLEVFAHPARFAALVGDDDPQPVVGVVTELLATAQLRGELRRDLEPAPTALTVVAGGLFPAVQAASLGADPMVPLASALDVLWGGLDRRV